MDNYADETLQDQNIISVLPNRYSYFLRKQRNYSQWIMHTPILISKQLIAIDSFIAAVNHIIRYHDVLRMNIELINNNIIQTIKPVEEPSNIVSLCKYDITSNSPFKEYVENKIKEIQYDINLPDNLLRILVIHNLESKTTVLFFLFHHALLDGYSFKLLVNDLFFVYNQILDNKTTKLPNESMTYKDFCAFSINFFRKNIKEEVEYWKSMPWSRLKKLTFENSELFNIESNSTSSISSMNIPSIDEFMKNFKGESSYGLVNLLLIAIAKVYARYFNAEIMLLDFVYNGRSNADENVNLDRTIGWISEAAPIFIPTEGSLDELMSKIESQIDKLYTNNSSYGYLKYIFHELKDDVFHPPDISFNYLPPWMQEYNYPDIVTQTDEFNIQYLQRADTQRVYLMNGGAYFKNNSFIISWNYSCALFSESKMNAFTNMCLEEFKMLIIQSNKMI